MKILGIDTSTKFLSLGLYDNGKIYEYSLEAGIKLSSLLAPAIERAVQALNWDIREIDYFACGLGPGSFTGIRIGMSTIKGLAWPLQKAVAGIPTLDILAGNVSAGAKYIVPIVDAKRGLIYAAIYKTKGGVLKRVMPYKLFTPEELYAKIRPGSVVFGDAVGIYQEDILRNTKGATILDKDYWYPKPRNIIALALERIKNKQLNTAFNLKPIYLYPKECQIRTLK